MDGDIYAPILEYLRLILTTVLFGCIALLSPLVLEEYVPWYKQVESKLETTLLRQVVLYTSVLHFIMLFAVLVWPSLLQTRSEKVDIKRE